MQRGGGVTGVLEPWDRAPVLACRQTTLRIHGNGTPPKFGHESRPSTVGRDSAEPSSPKGGKSGPDGDAPHRSTGRLPGGAAAPRVPDPCQPVGRAAFSAPLPG